MSNSSLRRWIAGFFLCGFGLIPNLLFAEEIPRLFEYKVELARPVALVYETKFYLGSFF